MGITSSRRGRGKSLGPTQLETPCIEWLGNTAGRGYGIVYIKRQAIYAHRRTYEMEHGPIPEGMLVMHRCDNPPCVNLEHLVLGTTLDNVRDCVSKGRNYKLPRFPGESNPKAKLTEREVGLIRRLAAKADRANVRFRKNTRFVDKLAERFGVSNVMIRNVIKGRNWKDAAVNEHEASRG